MRLTRRQLLAGGAAAGLAAGGIYELVDQLARVAEASGRRRGSTPEQHLLQGVRDRHGQRRRGRRAAAAPPARDRARQGRRSEARPRRRAADARGRAREARRAVRAEPGRPRRHGRLGAAVLPPLRPEARRRRTSPSTCARRSRTNKPVRVLLDARRFPSDPAETILEANDVAVLLRSDNLDHIAAGSKAILTSLDLFEVTSIRKGFAGGGFDGGRACRRRWRSRRSVRGSYLIPDRPSSSSGSRRRRRPASGRRRSRTSRARLQPRRVLRAGDAPRHLAHHRGHRGLVRQLPPRRARDDGLPAGDLR